MHPTLSLGIHPFVDRSFHPLQKIEFAGGFDYPALWHLDAARGPSTPSFDHLIGAQHETGWNVMTDNLRGLQIDHELELGRLFDRSVGGLGAVEYLNQQSCALTVDVSETRAIADYISLFGRLGPLVDGGQAQFHDPAP